MAKSAKRKTSKASAQKPASKSRRDFMKLARNGAIAAGVLGVGGYFSVQAVQATLFEGDLTRIGQGKPTVVQIHDPQCAMCTALQKQARKALKNMGDKAPEYVVANIRTPEGDAFAGRHGVPHVTLLLIDGAGQVKQILRGVQQAPVLQDAFEAFLKEARRS